MVKYRILHIECWNHLKDFNPSTIDPSEFGLNLTHSSLFRYLDFVTLMAYDLRGSWDQVTGCHSSLSAGPEDTGYQATLNQVFIHD